MPASPLLRRSSNKAAALIIVLAFVVLLTGLALTYFSRTTSERQLAQSSYNNTSADLVARTALDIVITDLKQEIVNGSSTVTPTPGTIIYVPTPAANIIPQRSSQIAAGVPNLIRRSVRLDAFIGNPAPPSRASAVNSTSDLSANGRSVSSTRWNSHYLVPKKNTGTNDSIPIDAFTNATPDWVFLTGQGPAVITAPDSSVIGRYAYAVYDEGGLVDMNAAGYPSPTTILQYGRKGSLAFADLTGLPGLSATAVDNIVGWRDYASSQPTGTLNPPSSNFSFTSNAANTYYNFILSDPTNIQLTNYFTGSPLSYFTNSFLTPSGAVTPSPSPGRTDQLLIARQELISLLPAASTQTVTPTPSPGGVSFSNALQSLGTFSREAFANVPQWSPAAPNATNPNFQTLLVTGSFTRNDLTTANVGDPLVNKRFLLQRLNWLTYKGPSANRTIPASAPPLGDANYDMWLLTRGAAVADMKSIRFGLTSTFLQDAVKGGTAANILKYFGLVWQDATNQPDPTQRERWNYVGHGGGNSPASSIATFGVGGTQAATREPDFFELLQAGILNGSLGDSYSPYAELPGAHQQSKMLHILTIGANLIAQSRADSYPVRIACTVNGTTMEAVGMPRLPCLSSLAVCPVGVPSTASGGMHWLLIPNLWDPFRDTWDLTEANASNTLSTPGYLRPPVRITVTGNASGSVDFGRTNALVSQSGRVDSTSVTTFNKPLTITPAQTLVLATGATIPAGFGRDGFREAMRLGASDISGTVTSFDPTTSPATDGYAWNDIVRPTNDASTYRTDHFIAFRVSFKGSDIGGSFANQNPVLILKSGFQVSLEYQSPNGQWYGYSFLQGVGKDATNGTWITPVTGSLGLCLATSFSQYRKPGGFSNPTIFNGATNNPSLWSDLVVPLGALAHSPMFAKGDPRSIRYNTQMGVVNLANPPMPFVSAGIIPSIWPSQYATPPQMTLGSSPTPTPTATPIATPTPTATPTPIPIVNPNPPNPATLGDNAAAGNTANPYNEFIPAGQTQSTGDNWRPVMMNRPFRSVGEMAYAFRDQPFRTLSFSTSNSADAGLLDLFTTNDYSGPAGTPTPTPAMRAGVISLNSAQAPAIASVLTSTIIREDTPRSNDAAPSPSPARLDSSTANNVATSLTLSTSNSPLINRASLASLILPTTNASPSPSLLDSSVPKTQREAIARALGETVQTRTWNLLIDLVAQTGHYKPNAASLQNDFVVEGEEHYWVHVAIDRFTGKVLERQVEAVKE